MLTRLPQVQISETPDLRNSLLLLLPECEKAEIAEWAESCIWHVMPQIKPDSLSVAFVIEAFDTLRKYLNGLSRAVEVRRASCDLHDAAGKMPDTPTGFWLRAAGHAVATGHSPIHAIVASDFCVKTLETTRGSYVQDLRSERIWQAQELEYIRKNISTSV